jgi:hypothetical protein
MTPALPRRRPASLADVQMHWPTLAFSRRDVEGAFLTEYAARSVFQVRLGIALGAALVAAYGALDAHIIPDAAAFARGIRFGLLVPALLVGLAFSYTRHFHRIMQPLPAVLGVITGAGIVAMTLQAGPPGNYLYYGGVLTTCVYLYTFVRLRFVVAAVASSSIVLLYEVTALLSGTTPAAAMISNSLFLNTVNVIGMSASYSIERHVRADFLQRRMLQEQLGGLLPICAWCKKIRDDRGYWSQLEAYIITHSQAEFSHSICPKCEARLEDSCPTSSDATHASAAL